MHAFYFNYQHVDCLYTIFKNRSSCKIFVKSGQLFDNVPRAVQFNHQNGRVHRMPNIAKKRFLRKKYKKHFLSCFQNIKSTQTSGSVFEDRLEEVKKNKIETKLITTVICLLDGHENYTSILVTFGKKSL